MIEMEMTRRKRTIYVIDRTKKSGDFSIPGPGGEKEEEEEEEEEGRRRRKKKKEEEKERSI